GVAVIRLPLAAVVHSDRRTGFDDLPAVRPSRNLGRINRDPARPMRPVVAHQPFGVLAVAGLRDPDVHVNTSTLAAEEKAALRRFRLLWLCGPNEPLPLENGPRDVGRTGATAPLSEGCAPRPAAASALPLFDEIR